MPAAIISRPLDLSEVTFERFRMVPVSEKRARWWESMKPGSSSWGFDDRMGKMSKLVFRLDWCVADSPRCGFKQVVWPSFSDIFNLSFGMSKWDNSCMSGVDWSASNWFRRSWIWSVKLASLARKRRTSLSRVLKYWFLRSRCVLLSY